MQKLSFQDAFFLRAETSTCPFHVALLLTLSPPENAPKNYLRTLAKQFYRFPEVWPVFGRRLDKADSTRNPKWVLADDYDPKDHVCHYRLPGSGTEADLLELVGRAHEQLLDRTRPLWQVHLIDGLPGGKFGLYFKVHHALVDGVGGVKLLHEMLTDNPEGRLLEKPTDTKPARIHSKETFSSAIKHSVDALLRQAKALPEAGSILANIGLDNLLGKQDSPQLPFSAPRTILNKELSTRRRFVVSELSQKRVSKIGKYYGGTINDVLIAIIGSALRHYLTKENDLPKHSLDAGIPVSVKSEDGSQGNQLSFMICPFGTDEKDPVKRLRKIIRTTKKAKYELAHVSADANEEIATLTMIPFLLVTLTHSSQKLPPVFNTIVSNVPGPKKTMYMEGSKLERIYPLSVVADGMGLNITIISYNSKLCIGVTCAPSNEPHIESLGTLIKAGYKELLEQADI